MLTSSSDGHEKEYEHLFEGAKSLLLESIRHRSNFSHPLFVRSQPRTPVGSCPRSCQPGTRGERTLYLKNGRCPPPLRGVRRERGCDTSEPVAAGSPLSAPAQCRSGSTGGRTPLIPAGGSTRHKRHHAAAEFSGSVGGGRRANASRQGVSSPCRIRTDLV